MLALVTCAEARDVDTDLPLLAAAMPEADIVVWDDDTVDWAGFERVIVRSTWDYHRDRHRFLSWAAAVADVTELWNPVALMAWNSDKRSLGELGAHGVPTVPTTVLDGLAAVEAFAARGGFGEAVVVKPSVGVSAGGVVATRGDATAGLAHATTLLAAGLTPLVQPELGDADGRGETGLVYLGGDFSHAFARRVVMRAELDGDLLGDEESRPRVASDAERAVGDAVMAALPATAYARVDLLPSATGPVVLEVELVEPSLFLHLDPEAPARAAAAFRSL